MANPRGSKITRLFGLAVTTVFCFGVGTVTALTVPLPNQPTAGIPALVTALRNLIPYQVSRPVNILVLGVDIVPGAKVGDPTIFDGNSDTMMLLHLDPATNTVNLLSIPRDTRVEVPGLGENKINSANPVGGPLLAAQTVSQALDGVSIDRYVVVSTAAFRDLVNDVGGLRVYVPEPMHYQDNTQNLHIDLNPGWQTLNGDEAEEFVRFREDAYGDVGRVGRQQELLKALRAKLTDPLILPQLPTLIQTVLSYTKTNLTPAEITSLVDFLLGLSPQSFHMVMLPGQYSGPGQFNASYWLMDPQARDRIMQQYFDINSTGAPLPPVNIKTLSIAVQNATGQPNMAYSVQQYLENQGFTNVYLMEDWPLVDPKTRIIVQGGDMQSASSVAQILGVGKLESQSTGSVESDLTIRVGQDWAALHPNSPTPQSSPSQ